MSTSAPAVRGLSTAATGLATLQPRFTANAKTPWAKVRWLATVFVESAFAFAAAYAATSSESMRSIAFAANHGARCERRIER